ncbi:site-specific integrase [Acetobacterium wieringae]|uniref:tyrosine-type recombinase/integrase n=1 Tax=Acetobacterium wieringae TaxID=52694 RepID=UPI003158082D
MKYDKVTIRGKVYFRYRHWDPVLQKHVKNIYGSTLKELKKKHDEFCALKTAGVKEEATTFNDFFKNWLYTVHLMDKKPSTKARYDSTYNTHIKDAYFSKIPIQKIVTSDLQIFYNQKFEEKGEYVVKNIHKLISPCVRYAFENGNIVRNFATNVKLPKDLSNAIDKHQKIRPLSFEEQKKFVNAIKGHPYSALFNTALDTGMRQGELFALTWADIDFSDLTIRINKNHSCVKDIITERQVNYTTNTKTAKSRRVIPLANRTKKILIEHMKDQKTQLLRIGIIQTENTLVFGTIVNTPLDSSNILKELKKVYTSIGITDKTFHDLRHTYATRLFELGEPAKTVQELLGHSNVNITLGTYTHVLEKQKTKTASLIDSLYEMEERTSVISIG